MPDDLPLGAPLGWAPVAPPRPRVLRGAHVLLRPLDPGADAEALYAASHPPQGDARIWAYLFEGPYESAGDLCRDLVSAVDTDASLFYTLVRLPDERPLGQAAYLRIVPEHGTIEIGNVWFGTALQRTTAATEAIYLLARHAFDDLGYRRLEWKCNALNAASRQAAVRFGFAFEGVFRNHLVVKGRNRDTAWYSITDGDWPSIRAGFEAWLAPENFDGGGTQRRPLAELIATARRSA